MERAWDQPGRGDSYFLAEGVASFEFGLARMLDGIEVFIEGRDELTYVQATRLRWASDERRTRR
jgi:hypothetical protein